MRKRSTFPTMQTTLGNHPKCFPIVHFNWTSRINLLLPLTTISQRYVWKSAFRFVGKEYSRWLVDRRGSRRSGEDISTWEMLGVKEYMFTGYKCERNAGYDLSTLAMLLVTWWSSRHDIENGFLASQRRKWTKLLSTRSSRDLWNLCQRLARKSSEYSRALPSPVRWNICHMQVFVFSRICFFFFFFFFNWRDFIWFLLDTFR